MRRVVLLTEQLAYVPKVGKDESEGAGLGILAVYLKAEKVRHRFARNEEEARGLREILQRAR